MKKQTSEQVPNNNWWAYITILLASIICAIFIFGYYFKGTPTMPESVKQEWIREKDREDAIKEYFTEIQKHLEVNFVDKETVQIVWKNWEMNRKYYPQPFAHTYYYGDTIAYFYDEDHRIDTIKIRIGK